MCISSLPDTRLSRFSRKTAEKFVGPKKPPDLMNGPSETGDRTSFETCVSLSGGEAIDGAADTEGVGNGCRCSFLPVSLPGGAVPEPAGRVIGAARYTHFSVTFLRLQRSQQGRE